MQAALAAADGRLVAPEQIAGETPLLWVHGLFPLISGETLLAMTSVGGTRVHQVAGDWGLLYLERADQLDGLEDFSAAVAALDHPEHWTAVVTDQLQPLRTAHDHARMTAMLYARKRERLLDDGVLLELPEQIRVEDTVSVAAGVLIEPGVLLAGRTRIEADARIGTGAIISNAWIGEGAEIRPYTVLDDCRVGNRAAVGPFAHIRPGSDLGPDVKVGNFVETKKAVLGPGSKASHLSYLGDTTIGRDCNIGAGTITCNYDGFNKHQTILGDDVFIGSDSQLVAPVQIGDGALIGAGSTITGDVPARALALSRAPQVVKDGRAEVVRDKARQFRDRAKQS